MSSAEDFKEPPQIASSEAAIALEKSAVARLEQRTRDLAHYSEMMYKLGGFVIPSLRQMTDASIPSLMNYIEQIIPLATFPALQKRVLASIQSAIDASVKTFKTKEEQYAANEGMYIDVYLMLCNYKDLSAMADEFLNTHIHFENKSREYLITQLKKCRNARPFIALNKRYFSIHKLDVNPYSSILATHSSKKPGGSTENIPVATAIEGMQGYFLYAKSFGEIDPAEQKTMKVVRHPTQMHYYYRPGALFIYNAFKKSSDAQLQNLLYWMKSRREQLIGAKFIYDDYIRVHGEINNEFDLQNLMGHNALDELASSYPQFQRMH